MSSRRKNAEEKTVKKNLRKIITECQKISADNSTIPCVSISCGEKGQKGTWFAIPAGIMLNICSSQDSEYAMESLEQVLVIAEQGFVPIHVAEESRWMSHPSLPLNKTIPIEQALEKLAKKVKAGIKSPLNLTSYSLFRN